MTDTPSASGADLARQALAAARASAKNAPTAAGRPPTRTTTRRTRGQHGDPQAFGSILGKLTAEQGWETGIDGGSLIDQWPQIAPTELATTVRPISYDPDRGLLILEPSTPAYATQVRLFQTTLIQHLNGKLGKPAVRTLRVLPPGRRHATAPQPTEQPAAPAPEVPVKTRDMAHPGYREALELALDHRLPDTAGDPYVEEAMRRQEAALRAHRQPEREDREAYWAQVDAEASAVRAVRSSDASRTAALAYKRQHAGGTQEPRRAFDVA
ncbi:DUF721 domain-containing protein [Streptomyces sp. ID05-39B]|uniref:DUF721 domain-containing protein n=1 Tax=Streptomyces sp. ID05-39B TaxID=3028664 RepID=UPI0029AA4E36|nr:DUF721 domain-containing protein [Streptomyces sp. ID05-39B]MDX3531946.1 DUF721 domain-containing protein [Streptomyces sp. ID05-39B]